MIQVRISPAQARKLESDLKEFARKSQIAVAETVAIIGREASKELASKIQPWGLSNAVGEKYEGNILKQVQKAARWANYKGTETGGGIAQVHSQYRNRKGSVTVRPPRQFQPKSKIIDKQEIVEYAKRKQANAGIAKSGWIAAGENIDSPLLKTKRGKSRKITVGKWIRRHVSGKHGFARMIRRQLISSSVLLTNSVSYAYDFGKNESQVERAIAMGYRKSIGAVKKLMKSLK
jgi:hypothetical protein